MLRRSAMFVAAAAVMWATGCTTPATEIVVTVDTDMAVPSELNAVEFALGQDEPTKARATLLSADDFPLQWVISTGGATESVAVDVRAMHGNTELLHRTALRAFKEEASRELIVHLWRRCLGVVCEDDEYCDERDNKPACVSLFDEGAFVPASADGGTP